MKTIVVANCHSTKFANRKIANWCWPIELVSAPVDGMLEITTALRAGDCGRK